MARQCLIQLFQHEEGNSEARGVLSRLGAEEQKARFRLPQDACDEVGRALQVERHDDDAAEQAAEEGRDPLGAVRRPDDDALAATDAARFEFAREASGRLRDAPVRPALDAQPASVGEGVFVAALQEVFEVAVESRTHKTVADKFCSPH